MWPERKLLDLLNIELPIIQAPMAGASGTDVALAVANAGGLGSLPFALLDAVKARAELQLFRRQSARPVNVNFFCHSPAQPDADREAAWRHRLAPYYLEHGVDSDLVVAPVNRAPFDTEMCAVVEELRPEIVSFHFGLPDAGLLARVKAAGCIVISSATTVAEARWLEAGGCDAVIAQGYEAGGHRGMFLTDDISTQIGTLALVPQIVDAVSVPVIAAGGIADGRGVAAAFMLGAAGVQVGTAYLSTPESLVTALHRQALVDADKNHTALTNIFSGRPARGLMNRVMHEVGPMTEYAPAFPTAGAALGPLKKPAEAAGSVDFSSLWSGQGVAVQHHYGRDSGAAVLTRVIAEEALSRLAGSQSRPVDAPQLDDPSGDNRKLRTPVASD